MKKILLLCLSMLLLFAVSPFALAQEPAVKLDELSPAEEKAYVEELLAREEAERKTTFHQQQSVDLRFWQELLELNEKDLEQIKKNKGLSTEKNALLQDKIEEAMADIQKDPSLSDAEKISWLLSTLFRLRDLDFYNSLDVDFTIFMEKSLPLDPGCQYFLDDTTLSKQASRIHEERGRAPLSQVTLVEINKMQPLDDLVFVEAEVSEYHLGPRNDVGRGSCEYGITMVNLQGQWYIRSMYSDDPRERHFLEQGKRLDVEGRLEELRNPEEMPEEIKALNAKAEQEHKAFLEREEARKQQLMETYKRTGESIETRTYNRSAASSYAITYDSYTSNNPYFDFFDDVDCQNFASQCLWRGFGGRYADLSNRKAPPMISDGDRDWYTYTNSWINVPDFEAYMDDGGYNEAGPYGFLYYGNLAYAQVGDIIHVDWDYNASPGAQDHAYIVTNVYGTYGARTMADIKISAHTGKRENEYLTYLAEYDEEDFLLISLGEWVASESESE